MLEFKTLGGRTIKTNDWFSFNETVTEMAIQINKNEYLVFRGFKAYLKTEEKILGVMSYIQGTSKISLYGIMKNDQVLSVEIDIMRPHKPTVPTIVDFDKIGVPLKHWKPGILLDPNIYIKKVS